MVRLWGIYLGIRFLRQFCSNSGSGAILVQFGLWGNSGSIRFLGQFWCIPGNLFGNAVSGVFLLQVGLWANSGSILVLFCLWCIYGAIMGHLFGYSSCQAVQITSSQITSCIVTRSLPGYLVILVARRFK
jgi:hypothetical protein